MIPLKTGLEEAIAQLKIEDLHPFTRVMKHGSMSVEYFAPRIKDFQTPHTQDEIYVIISGKSLFIRDTKQVSCMAGDILFVPAGMIHRFENFSEDFATWVIFYGPEGGER